MNQPLNGIRVIALEQAVAMPFCTFMLAELGAEIIKIERPGTGDVIRGWDDVACGLSSGFVWVNANKRDVTVDLGEADGREIVRRLVATADVFVENLAPGVVGRLGLGPDDLRRQHRRLVYCSLSGFGQSGPYRDVKAYDLIVQGEAGVVLTNGTPGEPAKVGLPITDLVAGATAALGILAALYQREQIAQGAVLDISMLDAMVPWLGYFPHHAWHTGAEPPRSGLRHQYLCPYGPYQAADGEFVNLVVASDADWQRFCREVVEEPQWIDDPVLGSIEARRRNRAVAEQVVEAVIATRPAAEWLQRLESAGLAHGRVRTIADVLAHPQLAARHMFVWADSPVGPLPLARFALGSAATKRHVPDLGEDNEVVLKELGYSSAEISTLHNNGVI